MDFYYDELPEGYKDALFTTIDIRLDWLDRIKVLFGWLLTVKAQILTENIPGKTETIVKVYTWRYRKPKRLGVVTADGED